MAEHRIEQVVDRLAAELPKPVGRWANSGTTRTRSVRTIVRGIGGRRINRQRMAELDIALKDRGVFANRPLSEPNLRQDDRVRFSLSPFRPDAPRFGREELLADLISDQIGNVAPFRGLVLLDREVRLANGMRVDMLCEERSSGRARALVFIELKKGGTKDRLATQVRRYFRAIRATPEYVNRRVRATVIASEIDDATVEILRQMGDEVELLTYQIQFVPPQPA